VARKPFDSPGGLWDRFGQHWVVVDVDGTRAVARGRALPQLESDPAPHRRFEQIAAPGYFGRKRGEVVRTRITVLQAHTHQWALLGVQATAITEEI
jgi:FPC/CPF motif-containing protein YcgG